MPSAPLCDLFRPTYAISKRTLEAAALCGRNPTRNYPCGERYPGPVTNHKLVSYEIRRIIRETGTL
jgi:hypothetical protein